jgi:hypothetical protein
MSTRRRALPLAVSVVSLALIVFEISLTKIFSVTLWYHFAYLTVSLALFGLGAGGLAAFYIQHRVSSERLPRLLRDLCFASGAAVTLCVAVVTNVRLTVEINPTGLLHLAVLYLLCSVPFFMNGMVLSLIFRANLGEVSRLYGFDLLGAGLGCVLFLAAISVLSGPTVALLPAVLMAAAGILLLNERPRAPSWIILAAACLPVALSVGTDVFSIRFTKSYRERTDLLFEKWSPLARITVYPKVFWFPDPRSPFGWGFSRTFRPTHRVEELWIEQDSSAGTPITAFDGDLSKLEHLKYDICALPYYLGHRGKVFIVGVGGGRDVLTALAFGSPQVEGCDINPVVIGLVKDRFRDFAGDLFNRRGVKIHTAEARNFIRRSTETYGLIQISLIDSWAATLAGAFTLSENSLYTVEAVEDFLEHLEPDGLISFTRYLFYPRSQSLRVACLARAALERRGVENPEDHIAVVSNLPRTGTATIMVKKTPFTAEDMGTLRETASKMQFSILYLPGQPADKDFADAILTEDFGQFVKTQVYDVRPTTDDRPFFFQMTYFSKALGVLKGEFTGQVWNYYAHFVLAALALVAAALTALFYFVPMRFGGRGGAIPGPWGVYFLMIGLGFIFAEIPLLQKGAFYLGHPTYSFSVVLFSLLVFSGLGSHISRRVPPGRVPLLLGLNCALLLVMFLAVELVFPATVGRALPVRVALTVLILGIGGITMGMPFPLGLARLGAGGENAVPWAWAVNGGASVLGSIAAMAIAMSHGYRMTYGVAVACYLLAAALAWKLRRGGGTAVPRARQTMLPQSETK